MVTRRASKLVWVKWVELLVSVLLVSSLVGACTVATPPIPTPIQPTPRLAAIPSAAVKMAPQTDLYPPILHSEEWQAPIPVPGMVNTRGAEDSPFITPDGGTLYFFFTPDALLPAETQVMDGVTGIYRATWQGESWDQVERVVLQEPGKLAMDGCPTLQGTDILWFCSVREGLTGIGHFTAGRVDGEWLNWAYASDQFDPMAEVGELHVSADGKLLYYHADRAGGLGELDIWRLRRAGAGWSEPENVTVLNTPDSEGWPFLRVDGSELWFTRTFQGAPAVFRAKRIAAGWREPELVVSQFAGEPTLDAGGNLYFVHHYFRAGSMIEADIYVAYHK